MHPDDLWRRQQVSVMTEKAKSLGITYEEYLCRLSRAAAEQREWTRALNAVGWDHSKSPTENLARLNS